MNTAHRPRPYQVCLLIAGNLPEAPANVKVVDLIPAEATVDAVVAKLKESKLTPADLRSHVYVYADGDRDKALAMYSALIGFAGRRLDFDGGVGVYNADELDRSARKMQDVSRPDPRPDHLQLGGDLTHPDLPTITAAAADALTPADVSDIRYARRLRFVAPAGTLEAIAQLIILGALRARRDGSDRLPFLVAGDEPVVEDPSATVGLCLDTVRRAAVELRRGLRPDNRDAVAERISPNPRQVRLLTAATLPVDATMIRLGASMDPETLLWHCPRPERHTHGDANASMKIFKNLVQCFRCDPERVDALRLAMDTLGLSADEAAAWLAVEANVITPHVYGVLELVAAA